MFRGIRACSVRANLVGARNFSTGGRLMNESLGKSSCKAGTILNLKIRKAGDEPVALEDSEYPEWLWDSLNKEKMDEDFKKVDFMRWRKRQIGKQNASRIKNNNFLSQV